MELNVTVNITDEELAVLSAMKMYPSLFLHCDQIRQILADDPFYITVNANWVRVRVVSLHEKNIIEKTGKKGSHLYRPRKNLVKILEIENKSY